VIRGADIDAARRKNADAWFFSAGLSPFRRRLIPFGLVIEIDDGQRDPCNETLALPISRRSRRIGNPDNLSAATRLSALRASGAQPPYAPAGGAVFDRREFQCNSARNRSSRRKYTDSPWRPLLVMPNHVEKKFRAFFGLGVSKLHVAKMGEIEKAVRVAIL